MSAAATSPAPAGRRPLAQTRRHTLSLQRRALSAEMAAIAVQIATMSAYQTRLSELLAEGCTRLAEIDDLVGAVRE